MVPGSCFQYMGQMLESFPSEDPYLYLVLLRNLASPMLSFLKSRNQTTFHFLLLVKVWITPRKFAGKKVHAVILNFWMKALLLCCFCHAGIHAAWNVLLVDFVLYLTSNNTSSYHFQGQISKLYVSKYTYFHPILRAVLSTCLLCPFSCHRYVLFYSWNSVTLSHIVFLLLPDAICFFLFLFQQGSFPPLRLVCVFFILFSCCHFSSSTVLTLCSLLFFVLSLCTLRPWPSLQLSTFFLECEPWNDVKVAPL